MTGFSIDIIGDDSLALVNRFYKINGDKSKARPGELVIIAYQDGVVVAALRLQAKRCSWYCLRGVCVAKSERGQGIGKRLLREASAILKPINIYCFTFPYLRGFYQDCGFELWDRADVDMPNDIRAEALKAQQRGKSWCLMKGFTQP